MLPYLQWLHDIIADLGGTPPVVTTTLADNNKMKITISFSIAFPKEGYITLTTSSSKTSQRLLVERYAFHTLLQSFNLQLRYMFPDYSYFKLKALEQNEDVLAMTPRLSRLHAAETVGDMNL
jgi:hypothetical protein